jgi:hypothetical protein
VLIFSLRLARLVRFRRRRVRPQPSSAGPFSLYSWAARARSLDWEVHGECVIATSVEAFAGSMPESGVACWTVALPGTWVGGSPIGPCQVDRLGRSDRFGTLPDMWRTRLTILRHRILGINVKDLVEQGKDRGRVGRACLAQ